MLGLNIISKALHIHFVIILNLKAIIIMNPTHSITITSYFTKLTNSYINFRTTVIITIGTFKTT